MVERTRIVVWCIAAASIGVVLGIVIAKVTS